jgi:hypothetical protein
VENNEVSSPGRLLGPETMALLEHGVVLTVVRDRMPPGLKL